jgi:hypothetical protein
MNSSPRSPNLGASLHADMDLIPFIVEADRAAYSASCRLTRIAEAQRVGPMEAQLVLDELRKATCAWQRVVSHLDGEVDPNKS